MRRRPENAGTEIEIAVTDHRNSQPAFALIRQRDADSGLRVVADAESAAVAVVPMMLVEVQKHALPVTGELVSGPDGPIVVFDLRSKLGNHTLDTDRADVPSVSGVFDLFDTLLFMRR